MQRIMDLSIYLRSHNEVIAVHQDYKFIYTDGPVLNEKAAAAEFLTIYLLLNAFKINFLYFLQSYMLYI